MSRTFFAFPIAIALGLTLGLSGLLNPTSESNKVLPVLAQGGCTHPINWTCVPTSATKTSAMSVTYADVNSSSVRVYRQSAAASVAAVMDGGALEARRMLTRKSSTGMPRLRQVAPKLARTAWA